MCKLTFETVTLAVKAKRYLGGYGIGASVVSIDPSTTKKGCGYATMVNCRDVLRASALLNDAGIRYGEII